MTPPFKTQYISKEYTHNFANLLRDPICSKKRPCYREQTCRFCQERKSWFIGTQIVNHIFKWNLNLFCTASIVAFAGHPQEGLQSLKVIRSYFHRKIFRKEKYISVIAIGERGRDCFSCGYTPHFHVLMEDSLIKAQFASLLKTAVPDFKWNIQVKPIRQTRADAKRIASYLMTNNYFPTLKYRSHRIRLISASRGMYTGRPRKLT